MRVFVGTYTEPILFGTGKLLEGKGEGIHEFHFDPARGRLTPVGVTRNVVNPSYLALDCSGRHLYAVNELKAYEGRPTGTVTAFEIRDQGAPLRRIDIRRTHGTDPCHVVLDDAATHAFVANFASGSICVLPIRAEGGLDEASDFIQHVGSGIDPVRQKGPHAHAVTLDPGNRFAFVPDLGLDKLFVYRFDATRGMLEPHHSSPGIKTRPGAGPRHLAFHPNGRFAYLVNELDSTVLALRWHAAPGAFELLQTISTLPAGFAGASTCADIQVEPQGEFIIASNRGHDSLAIFRIDAESGLLEALTHASTAGRTPRSFGIDPEGRYVLAANQDSDTIVTLRIDRRSGLLAATGEVVSAPTPVCVKFLAAR